MARRWRENEPNGGERVNQKTERPSAAGIADGLVNQSPLERFDEPFIARFRPGSQSQFSITDRLCARALVLAVLGQDYEEEIALARALARSQERRAL